MLRHLAATYDMKIDEETIDEKATSMSSVMSSLLIFPLLMHSCMCSAKTNSKESICLERLCQS